MSIRQYADLQLRCTWCGDEFVFSAGEQQLYALRGIDHQPQRCPGCVRGRNSSGLRQMSTQT